MATAAGLGMVGSVDIPSSGGRGTERVAVVPVVATIPAPSPRARVAMPTPSLTEPAADEPADQQHAPTVPAVESSRPAQRPPKLVRAPSPPAPLHTPAERAADLASVPEIGLFTFNAGRETLARPAGTPHPALALFDSRPDLGRLPIVREDRCVLSTVEGRLLGRMSDRLRTSIGEVAFGAPVSRCGTYRSPDDSAVTAVETAAAYPSLATWVLQAEADPGRQLLVNLLTRSRSPAATNFLAQRAVFDPSADLRRQAVQALKRQSPADARPLLLAALQYPWPVAADQAAATLIALDDRAAVPDLVRLLDAPDPARPHAGGEGVPVVREMVRINHFRNCQLCHAPSYDRRDSVRGWVPAPERPLPPSFSSPVLSYRQAVKPAGPAEVYIRADVTYLRPDFSTALPVDRPGPWPAVQRFDFIVRTRPARPWETDQSPRTTYPQREAVLRALRELTQSDFGGHSEDWRAGLANEPRLAALR